MLAFGPAAPKIVEYYRDPECAYKGKQTIWPMFPLHCLGHETYSDSGLTCGLSDQPRRKKSQFCPDGTQVVCSRISGKPAQRRLTKVVDRLFDGQVKTKPNSNVSRVKPKIINDPFRTQFQNPHPLRMRSINTRTAPENKAKFSAKILRYQIEHHQRYIPPSVPTVTTQSEAVATAAVAARERPSHADVLAEHRFFRQPVAARIVRHDGALLVPLPQPLLDEPNAPVPTAHVRPTVAEFRAGVPLHPLSPARGRTLSTSTALDSVSTPQRTTCDVENERVMQSTSHADFSPPTQRPHTATSVGRTQRARAVEFDLLPVQLCELPIRRRPASATSLAKAIPSVARGASAPLITTSSSSKPTPALASSKPLSASTLSSTPRPTFVRGASARLADDLKRAAGSSFSNASEVPVLNAGKRVTWQSEYKRLFV